MRKLASLLVVVVAAVWIVAVAPQAGAALNKGGGHTYEFDSAENFGVAANGDRVEVTCESHPVNPNSGQHICGTFRTTPKSLPQPPSGEFVHRDGAGHVLGAGTWTATKLINFDAYGCGVVAGNPIPPDFCGGVLKMAIVLDTPIGQRDAVLTVFCIVGPNPPNSHDDEDGEGVTLNVPGHIHFNHSDGGENVYIKKS